VAFYWRGVLADFRRISQITPLQTGVLCDAGQHSGAHLLASMECKDKIGKSIPSRTQESCESLTVALHAIRRAAEQPAPFR
jgi:hypothetical protein